MKPESVQNTIDRLYRDHSGKLIASLVSFFRLSNLQTAEDLVQNTFVAALAYWQKNGIPDDPPAWLFKVCKNKALNELKRRTTSELSNIQKDFNSISEIDHAFLEHEIKDNQLRLLFATCHPAFSQKGQIILTLKSLAGFTISEIGKALHLKDETVKKTLARIRTQIRKDNMPLKVPFLLQSKERLQSVHQVLYLIFNEGYSASSGDQIIRKALCLQSIRLLQALLQEEKIRNGETHALMALMLLNVARFAARIDRGGFVVELSEQDRTLWDHDLIRQGIVHFNQAKHSGVWSRYHFEAAIASLHCTAKCFSETNWTAIIKLYDQLLLLIDSDTIRLNRFIALYYAGQKQLALTGLQNLNSLKDNAHYLIALATVYHDLGASDKVVNLLLDALNKTQIQAERTAILKKIEKFKK